MTLLRVMNGLQIRMKGVKIDSESRSYLENIRYFDNCKSRQEKMQEYYTMA